VPEVTLTPFLSIFCLMCMAFFYSPVVVAMAAAIFSCGVFYSFLGFGNAMPDEPHNNLFILVRLAGFVISSAVAVLFSLFRQKAFYAQELTAAILSSLPIPVLITDATGVVSMSNQEMQRRLNMRQSQVFGKTWASLVMAMQDEGQATRTYIEIFAKSSTTGVDVPLRLAGNPSKDVPGRLLCIGKGERRLMVTVVVG